MRVVIDEVLFAEEALHEPLLTLLFACGFLWNEHHRVIIEPDEGGAWSEWRDALPQSIREELEWLLEGWVQEEVQPASGDRTLTVRISGERSQWNKPVMSLSVFEALKILSRPFEVHVEDDHADRAFLLSIARTEWRQRIEKLEKEGRLVFFHGGGITNMLLRMKRLRDGPVARRLRIWAMFDTDALSPGHPSTTAKELESKANRHIAGHWMLERRSVESYVPARGLERWARDKGFEALLEAFNGLDEEHRRHFNMKRGLGRDRGRDDYTRTGEAFWRDQETEAALQSGFGRKLSDIFAGEEPSLERGDYDADARKEADQKLGELLRML